MNKAIKVALIFLAGVATGGAGTFVFCKRRFDDLTNKELDAAKEYYDNLYATKIELLENELTVLKDGVVPEKKLPKKKSEASSEVEVEQPTKKEKKEYEDVVKTNYNAISTQPDIPVTSKKKPAKKKVVKSELEDPCIITMEQYAADKKFDKRCFTYLDQEDMFIDEEYMPVEDAREQVGNTCTDIDYSEDGQSVYVRNVSLGTDYEIVINVTDDYQSFCAD